MVSVVELAKACGVSRSTADRALNQNGRVSDATRKKVLVAAQRLGYVANPAVREIIDRKTMLVGAAFPNDAGVMAMDMAQGIQRQIATQGYRLFVSAYGNSEEFGDVLATFRARRFAAALALPQQNANFAQLSQYPPLRVASLHIPSCNNKVPSLLADNHQGLELGLNHLKDMGHRRIVYVTYPLTKKQDQGYADHFLNCCKTLGLEGHTHESISPQSCPPDAPWSMEYMTSLDEDRFIEMMRRATPTAIFFHMDHHALVAERIMFRCGFKIPQDVSMLVLHHGSYSARLQPALSYMQYPFGEIGRQVLRWLQGEIKTFTPAAFSLVERESVRRM